MASVTLKNLTKQFNSGNPALRELWLEVRDGEFLVLLGPTGCGKTTTLRCIAGLEEPTDGQILIGDRDVTQLSPGDRDVAMVFQNYSLYPHLTVRDNIGFPLALRRGGRRAARPDGAARPPAGRVVGRRAPAGGFGPGHRARAEGVPVRRAALQSRRPAAARPPRRAAAAASRSRHYDAVRHARPDRGADDG